MKVLIWQLSQYHLMLIIWQRTFPRYPNVIGIHLLVKELVVTVVNHKLFMIVDVMTERTFSILMQLETLFQYISRCANLLAICSASVFFISKQRQTKGLVMLFWKSIVLRMWWIKRTWKFLFQTTNFQQGRFNSTLWWWIILFNSRFILWNKNFGIYLVREHIQTHTITYISSHI